MGTGLVGVILSTNTSPLLPEEKDSVFTELESLIGSIIMALSRAITFWKAHIPKGFWDVLSQTPDLA